MMQWIRSQPVYVRAVVCLFVVLAIVPPTGWIVRTHVKRLVVPFPWVLDMLRDLGVKETLNRFILPSRWDRDLAAAGSDARDPDGQVAAALSHDSRGPAVQALVNRYPTMALVRAGAIRAVSPPGIWQVRRDLLDPFLRTEVEALVRAVAFGTVDEVAAIAEPLLRSEAEHSEPTGDVRRMLGNARAGAALEPDNAFFPLMESGALLRLRRDRDALEALHHAAGCRRYEDYTWREILARWRIAGRAGLDDTSLARAALYAGVRTPQVTELRYVGHAAASLASRTRSTGEALDIRLDLLRLSRVVRTCTTSAMGATVARGVARNALPKTSTDDIKSDDEAQWQTDLVTFARAARALGRADVARDAVREVSLSLEARRVLRHDSEGHPMLRTGARLCIAWLAGMALLSSTLWFTVVGVLVRRLRVLPSVRSGRGPSPWKWLIGPVAVVMVCGAAWLQAQPARELLELIYWLAGPTICTEQPPGVMESGIALMFWPIATIGPPMLLAMAVSVRSMWRRVPVTVGLATSLPRLCRAAGTAALLAFCAIAPFTAREEARMSRELDAMVRSEPKYLAAKACLRWPGATDQPPTAGARQASPPQDQPCGRW